jgi:hypothetical protein
MLDLESHGIIRYRDIACLNKMSIGWIMHKSANTNTVDDVDNDSPIFKTVAITKQESL